jgi:hypothetical protein
MKKWVVLLLTAIGFEGHSQIYTENIDRVLHTGSLRQEGAITVPVRWAKVEIKGTDKAVYADGTGYFVVDPKGMPNSALAGGITLTISAEGYETKEVFADRVELGVIFMQVKYKDVNPITVNDLMPDRPEPADAPTLSSTGAAALYWSDDPLARAADLQLGLHGFKMRGYDGRNTEIYINGAAFSDPESGYAFPALLSGFINIGKHNTGSRRLVNDHTYYGDVGGYGNIAFSPVEMMRRGRVSYSFGNSLYSHSVTASYSTGEMASGWALSLFASARSGRGYVQATDYQGLSYLFSVGRNIDESHSLTFFAAGAPTKRGMANYSTQSVYDRTGNAHFNSDWGYYQGKAKNSRHNSFHQPVIGLSHEWEGEISSWRTSALFSIGKTAETEIVRRAETDVFGVLYDLPDPLASSSLILWDSVYNSNRNDYLPERYLLDANVCDKTMFSLNSVYNLFDWGNLETTGGVEVKLYGGRYYNMIDDLLGGETFYSRDCNYDYSVGNQSYKIWNIWRYYYGPLKFALGGSASFVRFGYTGNSDNTVQPSKNFFNFSGKASVAYKLTRTSDIDLNAMYAHRAPLLADIYLSPRTSGDLLPGLQNEQIIAGEMNYSMYNSLLTLNVSAFFTMFNNRSFVRSYRENYLQNRRLTLGMTGLNSRNIGGEITGQLNFNPTIKADFAATYGIYRFTSDAPMTLSYEGVSQPVLNDTAAMQGLATGNTPQLAVVAGALYESPKNFWLGLNLAYTGMSYADVNPALYCASVMQDYTPEEQTALKGAFTLNLKGGYSFIFGGKHKKAISANINVQNLTGAKGILAAYRPFGLLDNDTRFAYMYGRTVYLMLSFMF